MDEKDLVILKHEENRIDDSLVDVNKLKESNSKQEERLIDMQQRIDEAYKRIGKRKIISVLNRKDSENNVNTVEANEDVDYDLLYSSARKSLISRGLDVDSISYTDFIDDTEINAVIEALDRGKPREERWKKSDFIVVFVVALIGCGVDFVLGNRNNPITGKGSKVSDTLNEIHEKTWKHATGGPIDFQGKINGISFGGGNHRELSKGHDLFRCIEAIQMFRNGKFEAIGYVNGTKIGVETIVNQYNNPYVQLPLIEAIAEYMHHMIADFCSNNSLPFPGYSFLQESTNRDIRKFAADMYSNGFNCKNVMFQSITNVIIEIVIRIYFSIMSVKKYKESIDIAEDYSNWEAIKSFVKPASKEKLNEMLLAAHTIVMAFNIGKIVIKKNVAEINITEIMSVVTYGFKVTKAIAKRNSSYTKIMYHAEEINRNWEAIEADMAEYDTLAEEEMKTVLEIA